MFIQKWATYFSKKSDFQQHKTAVQFKYHFEIKNTLRS